jgi:hypothetical protein
MNARIVILVAAAAAAAVAGCSRARESEAAKPSEPPKVAAAAPRPEPTPRAAPSPPVKTDAINDTLITSRIKAGILSDPGMAGSDVSVNTDHGVVNLTGLVKSQEQAAIASAHAQSQDGVMRVDSQLAVNMH